MEIHKLSGQLLASFVVFEIIHGITHRIVQQSLHLNIYANLCAQLLSINVLVCEKSR